MTVTLSVERQTADAPIHRPVFLDKTRLMPVDYVTNAAVIQSELIAIPLRRDSRPAKNKMPGHWSHAGANVFDLTPYEAAVMIWSPDQRRSDSPVRSIAIGV